MKVDFNKIYFGVKFVVIAAFAVLLVFLFWQKGAVGGAGAGIVYDVSPMTTTKFVYGLYPEGRVEIVENAWKIKNEPVYLKVYAPRKFKKAEITLKYQNSPPKADAPGAQNDKLQMFIGVKVKGGAVVPYYMKKLDKISADSLVEQTFIFDLAGAAFEKNKLQFIIAAPGIEKSNGLLIIESVKIQLL